MKFNLTQDQQKLYDETFNFAKNHLNSDIVERTKHQVFDRDIWEIAGQKGLPGLCISREYGGRGLSTLDTVIALEALGEGCEDGGFCFALGAHLLACAVPIDKYASPQLKAEYLPKLCNGEWIGANAMTEISSGSDVFDMASTATLEKGKYRLNGSKTYVTNAPVANVILAYLETNSQKGYFGGITAFLLDREKHEMDIIPAQSKHGLKTCTMGVVNITDLTVNDDTVVSAQGAGGQIFDYSMNCERTCLGAIHLGTMKRLLDQVISYINNRYSQGKSIGQYQAVSHKVAELFTQLQAARALTYAAASNLDGRRKTGLEGAATKLFVSETFKKFTIEIMQLFGGIGYRDHHQAGRILNDAIGATIYSGTSEVQKNIIFGLLKNRKNRNV